MKRLLFALLLLPAPALAADLYVSPKGDDTNSGTADAPYLTIQAAVDAAKPGDNVLVTKGIYREKVAISKSGDEKHRITVRATPRRAAITEGFTIKGNYLTVEGFQITHLFSSRVDSGLECKGDFNEILDNYIYEVHRYGLTAAGQNHVARNKIYKVNQGIIASGRKWLFESNEVSRIYNYNELDGDYARFFGEDGIWRGNFFHGNLPSERNGHPDGWQTFDSNGEAVHNILFEKNILADTVAVAMLQAWYDRKSSGLVFRNNVFANDSQGLNGGTISNVTVVNNVFYNIRGSCGGEGPGAIQKNNIYYNCKASFGTDYNLFYKTPMHAKTGTGNIVDQDPLFVDPAKFDFRLKPGSPALNAGEPVSGETKRPNIGAYDSDNSGPPIPPPPPAPLNSNASP
jgi:hypothetical protein